MAYIINSSALEGCFSMPKCTAENHLKFANHNCLKVLIWVMANLSDGVNEERISTALGIDVSEVEEALVYWCSAGVLVSLNGQKSTAVKLDNTKSEARAVVRSAKPTREEAAKRGLESKEVAFLLKEAELRFGRTLRQSEISTLVWLYDNEGLSAAAILMIIEYALSEGRCNIGFIERTAVDWINKGITDVRDIEKEISVMRIKYSAWHVVSAAMGIERRNPSAKELEDAYKWVDEWHFDSQMLKAAYDRCVDSISKFSMPYIRKIVEKWHKDGVDSLEKLKAYEENAQKSSDNDDSQSSGYDLQKAINSMF